MISFKYQNILAPSLSSLKEDTKDIDPLEIRIQSIILKKEDIICLTEVEPSSVNLIITSIPTHDYIYCPCIDRKDGNIILYNRSIFKMVSAKGINFLNKDIPCMKNDNSACIVILKSCNNRMIQIACTHLVFNPNHGSTRLMQLHTLLSNLDSNLETILCGDFNCLPNSMLIKFLLNKKLSNIRSMRQFDFSLIEKGNKKVIDNEVDSILVDNDVIHNINLQSIFDLDKNYITTDKYCVDYVFKTNNIIVTDCNSLPTNIDINTLIRKYSSDHIPLSFSFINI